MRTPIADDPDSWGRPMTGFFARLTDEQKAAALAYRGPENIGPAMYPADGGLSEPKMAFEDTTSLHAIVRQHFLVDDAYQEYLSSLDPVQDVGDEV